METWYPQNGKTNVLGYAVNLIRSTFSGKIFLRRINTEELPYRSLRFGVMV